MNIDDMRPEEFSGRFLGMALKKYHDEEVKDDRYRRALRDVVECIDYFTVYMITGDIWHEGDDQAYAVERYVPVSDSLSGAATSSPIITLHWTTWGYLVTVDGDCGDPVSSLVPGLVVMTRAGDIAEIESIQVRPFGMMSISVRSEDTGQRYSMLYDSDDVIEIAY